MIERLKRLWRDARLGSELRRMLLEKEIELRAARSRIESLEMSLRGLALSASRLAGPGPSRPPETRSSSEIGT